MQPLLPNQLISLWDGEKKYIIINGKRFSSWQEQGMLCFKWGDTEIDLDFDIFWEQSPKFFEELCRIVSLIFFWPEK